MSTVFKFRFWALGLGLLACVLTPRSAHAQFAAIFNGPPTSLLCSGPGLGLDKVTPNLYICALNPQAIFTWQIASGSGGGISGLSPHVLPVAATPTSLTNSLCDEGVTIANVLYCSDTNGMALPGPQMDIWGGFAAYPSPVASNSTIAFGPAGQLGISKNGGSFNDVLDASGINASVINAGVLNYPFVGDTGANYNYIYGTGVNFLGLTGDATTPAASFVTTVASVHGVSYPASPPLHSTAIVTATNVTTYKAFPDCHGAAQALIYTQSGDTPGCNTITSSGGSGVSGSTGVGIALTGTSYAPLFGQYSTIISTQANAATPISAVAVAISNLKVVLGTALSGSQTLVVTFQDNGSNESVTCTVPNSGTTCTDTTHSYSLAAGHAGNWSMVLNTGSVTSNVGIGAQIGNAAGSYTGNTTVAVSGTGSYPSGDGLKIDANSNAIDSGGGYVDAANSATVYNKTFDQASSGNSLTQLNMSGPQTAITGTGSAVAVYSFSVPANMMSASACIRANVVFKHGGGTGTVTYSWQWNGVQAGVTWTNATNLAVGQSTLTVCNNASTSAQALTITNNQVATTNFQAQAVTAAVPTTSNVTVAFMFSVAATDNVTPELWTVELVQ